MKQHSHTAPTQPRPIRLQEYGVGLFEVASTKSAWKKAIKKQYVTVDGKVATTASWIRGGESIVLSIPDQVEPKSKLMFPLAVVFEDEYLAIIRKPAGILVSGNGFKTIAHALSQNLKASSLSDACIPQPVHRLDYATTGLLLVGKTGASIRALNKLFEEKQVAKVYHAVTIGEMRLQGTIATPIDAKPSRSHYTLLESVASQRFGQLNLVKLSPETGRRHQLRKHLASIGNPILGDKEYGMEGLILNGKGMYLHASSLSFIHPFSEEKMVMKDELPERFRKIFSINSLI